METKTLAILYCALFALSIAKKDDVKLMSILKTNRLTVGDSGQAVNCGTVPINFTWSPKDLKSSGEVTIFIDYTLPHDLYSGFFNLSIFFHGDTQPFLGFAENYNCDLLKKYIPCPVTQGLRINTQKTITNLHALTSYPGTYDLVLQVWNSDQLEMFCINATIQVIEINF